MAETSLWVDYMKHMKWMWKIKSFLSLTVPSCDDSCLYIVSFEQFQVYYMGHGCEIEQ